MISSTRSTLVGRVLAVLALVLMVVPVLFPFYAASGLAAPLWAVVLLLVVWVALFLLGIRWFRSRPYAVLLLPLVAAGIWFAAMYAGEALLGWTA